VGRVSWDEYFLELARTTATRATCSRRKHGAVIVKDRRIVATGYNGGPSGYPHCEDGGCPRATSDAEQGHDYERCIAIHAEANALLFSSPEERERIVAVLHGRAVLRVREADRQLRASPRSSRQGGRYDGWDEVRDFLRNAGVRVRRARRPGRHPLVPRPVLTPERPRRPRNGPTTKRPPGGRAGGTSSARVRIVGMSLGEGTSRRWESRQVERERIRAGPERARDLLGEGAWSRADLRLSGPSRPGGRARRVRFGTSSRLDRFWSATVPVGLMFATVSRVTARSNPPNPPYWTGIGRANPRKWSAPGWSARDRDPGRGPALPLLCRMR
jgi:dCMP deaminase